MFYIYVGCFTFGILYSILSVILGGHGADHGGADHGGFHGHDASHNADMPSPFNPLVIASAITTFGAAGLVAKVGFRMGDLMSSALSLAFAGVVGTAIFFGIVKLMYGSQSNSTFSQNDLIGVEARVITPVPAEGLGEVAYVINGMRCTMSARSAYGREIPKGETVIIKDVAGNAAVVAQKVTIEDIEALDAEIDKAKKNKIGE